MTNYYYILSPKRDDMEKPKLFLLVELLNDKYAVYFKAFLLGVKVDFFMFDIAIKVKTLLFLFLLSC